jgi:mRNA turnover protein 4
LLKKLRESSILAKTEVTKTLIIVMAKALGDSEENEYKKNLGKLSTNLVGNVGLFFTDQNPTEMNYFFENHQPIDYARTGSKSTLEFSLKQGPLIICALPVPHNMEPHLRKLGLPTELIQGIFSLIQGVVHLRSDHTICKVNDVLTPEQSHLLVFL